MDKLPIRRALLSVSDKAGLADLARALAAHGAALVSTGGTAAALRAAGLPVEDVAAVSGFPEMLDGRVKTLVPQIHGGILARRDVPAHMADLAAHGIPPVDLVVVNLYPFAATVASGADPAACVETIDVGGPAMIRAAAKNFDHVAVLTEPAQYGALVAALPGGGTTLDERRALAGAAFAHVAAYDAAIAKWFAGDDGLPERLVLTGTLRERLRYGENPHQRAALYASGAARPGVLSARQAQGKALSYNNVADTDAAIECIAEFAEPAVVIVKHANPCGVATAPTLLDAWRAALAGDPVSAFGGVVAANRVLDVATAEAMAGLFTEVIAAADATPEALVVLSARKNLRLLLVGAMPDPAAPGMLVRGIAGGLLAQTRDTGRLDPGAPRLVSRRPPGAGEAASLRFAWTVCKHVKSNAIVLARDGATLGIGAGQMSRLDAARIAVAKAREAGHDLAGAVAASDAFFPFADGLQVLAEAGVAAVIQPGGSVRDADVIAAADAAGMAMLFTGLRHFRH